MKIITKILLLIALSINAFVIPSVFAAPVDNLNIGNIQSENSVTNDHFDNVKDSTRSIDVSTWGEKWAYNFMIRIAKDLKNLFFFIAWLYLMFLVLKLLFAEKSEDEAGNFKKWIIWTSVWLVIMQLSYTIVKVLYDKDVWEELAVNFIETIVNPLIKFIETWASFLFIGIAIYAFYAIVTANGDEEKIKTWKMSVVYGIVWFIIIKFSGTIVNSVYWKINCPSVSLSNIFDTSLWNKCIGNANLGWIPEIIVNIINWMNSFVWIAVILMIIYAWVQVLLSAGDEEKLKNAKKSILYVAIWLLILVMNYLILTFFIIPNSVI